MKKFIFLSILVLFIGTMQPGFSQANDKSLPTSGNYSEYIDSPYVSGYGKLKFFVARMIQDSAYANVLFLNGKPFTGTGEEAYRGTKIAVQPLVFPWTPTSSDKFLLLRRNRVDFYDVRTYGLFVQNRLGYWEKVDDFSGTPFIEILSDDTFSAYAAYPDLNIVTKGIYKRETFVRDDTHEKDWWTVEIFH